MGKLRKILRSIAKWLGILILIGLALLLLIIILIRTPWAQQKITNYATNYVSDKTGTAVEIDKLFITFRGNLQLDGLYLEGLQSDTLLYSHQLEAGVGILPLINGNIHISRVDWTGLKANISRGNDSTFNFQFIIDALAPADNNSQPPPADTTDSTPPGISIGPIKLADFQLHYLDSIAGMEGYLQLGELNLQTDDIDPLEMHFAVAELDFRNSYGRLVQFKLPPPSEDRSSTPLPDLTWQEINLENIVFKYASPTEDFESIYKLGNLQIGESQLLLSDQQITGSTLLLTNSDVKVKLPAAEVNSNTDPNPQSSSTFSWPDWQLNVNELEFDQVDFQIDQGSGAPKAGSFDPQHLSLQNIRFRLQDVRLEEGLATVDLKELAFKEAGGFELAHFDGEFQLKPQNLSISSLDLQTGHSELHASLRASFNHLDSLLSNPAGNSTLSLQLGESTSLSLRDAFYFNDSLGQDSLIQVLAPYPIRINGELSGQLSDLRINQLEVEALRTARLSLSGEINGLPDTNNISVDLPAIRLHTTAADLALLTDTGQLPAYLDMQASLQGSVHRLRARVNLSTPKGQAQLTGNFGDLMSVPAYRGQLKLQTFEVGALAGISDLKPVSLSLDFDGQGKAPENLQLTADIDFQQLIYRDYDYRNLELSARVAQQKAALTASHRDSNLSFTLDAAAFLKQDFTDANLRLNLEGADLQDLNLLSGRAKVATELEASFSGNPRSFKSDLIMTSGLFMRGETTYRLDSLFALLENDSSHSMLEIDSEFLQGSLSGNRSMENLVSAIRAYVQEGFSKDSLKQVQQYRDLDMKGEFIIADSPILTDILLPGLSRMDSIRITTAFKPADDILQLDVEAPEIVYQDFELSQLYLDFDGNRDSLKVNLSFDRFLRDPVDMHRTQLNIDLNGRQGNAFFEVLDAEEEEVFYTAVDISGNQEELVVSVDPAHLTLNGKPWNIPEANAIRFREGQPSFDQFVLSRNEQQLAIQSTADNNEMSIELDGFTLQALFSIFNEDEAPASGLLNGQVRLVNLQQTPGFTADLQIEEFGAMGNKLGTLSLKGNNRGSQLFDLEVDLTGPQVDLALNGTYTTSGKDQQVDISIDLSRLEMPLLEGFVPEQLDSTKGQLSGKFELKGAMADLRYDGNINFQQVRLVPVKLGTVFRLNNENVKVNNDGISLDNFSLSDVNGNKFVLDGQIGLEHLNNPSFDLEVEAEDFRLLEVDDENNPDLYGTAVVNLKLEIDGDMNLPVVEARVRLTEQTDVTYVIPASTAQMESRQGIVRFRNMKDSIDIFADEEDVAGAITGFDLSARIILEPGTRIKVVVDPQAGDNLTVMGEAGLDFNLSPNGNMTLTGRYELSDGHYQLNLYELVKKKFMLVEGSKIVWTGDPQGAELDITAIYKTEASASSLMTDPGGRYQQQLPFEVMLYIEGTIREPEISFGLDMPEDSRAAFGGTVYSQIRQLNENEAELNKQVFSLIVFDRFLPTGSVTDDGNPTSDLARNSVSKLLTGQLNKLADKYIKGVELDVNVDSYRDYSSGQGERRTDLNVSLKKAFFDDRVIVKVGSEVGIEGERQPQEKQLVGDVSVEYLIDEDGNYRLRAFRKDEYQDIVEGQVIVTGLGILFNKEFDTWEELWSEDTPNDEAKEEEEESEGETEKEEDDED